MTERVNEAVLVREVARLRDAIARAIAMVNGYSDTDFRMREEVLAPALHDHAVAMETAALATPSAEPVAQSERRATARHLAHAANHIEAAGYARNLVNGSPALEGRFNLARAYLSFLALLHSDIPTDLSPPSPSAEPVAWMSDDGTTCSWFAKNNLLGTDGFTTPLYTTPPAAAPGDVYTKEQTEAMVALALAADRQHRVTKPTWCAVCMRHPCKCYVHPSPAAQDTVRLDWLENEMGLDYKVHLRQGRLAAYIDVSGREYDAAYEGDDLRAAIDSAMQAARAAGGE